MIVLVFAAFISIGLPDAIFGVAWPSMRQEFDVGNAAVGWLNIPGSAAYFASSAFLGTLLRRLGVARLLIVSTAIVGAGLTLYATTPVFWGIIPAVMLMASGSGAIDAALNLFAAQNLPTRYMSWLHAFYGIGALAGPLIMAVIFHLGASWRWGYAIIAMILWLMSLVFLASRNAWRAATAPSDEDVETESMPITGTAVLRMPRVQLSVLMMMAGSIIESVAALWIASMLIQRYDVSASAAALGTGMYWIGLTVGRIVIPIIWPHAAPKQVQRWSTIVVIVAAIAMVPESLPATTLGVIAIGFGAASIFPVAMTISTARFGDAISQHLVGYLVSASTVVFAVMPILSGWLADTTSFAIIPWLLLLGGLLLLLTQVALARGDVAAVHSGE